MSQVQTDGRTDSLPVDADIYALTHACTPFVPSFPSFLCDPPVGWLIDSSTNRVSEWVGEKAGKRLPASFLPPAHTDLVKAAWRGGEREGWKKIEGKEKEKRGAKWSENRNESVDKKGTGNCRSAVSPKSSLHTLLAGPPLPFSALSVSLSFCLAVCLSVRLSTPFSLLPPATRERDAWQKMAFVSFSSSFYSYSINESINETNDPFDFLPSFLLLKP